MLDVLSNYIDISDFGYMILFLYSMGGGYVGIIAAGVLSANGMLDIYLSILIAILGNISGSTLYAYLARFQKKEFYKYFKKHKRKLAMMSLLIKKYDWWIILTCKYLHGIRTLIPLAIGLSKFSFVKFLVINIIACIIWGFVLGFAGFYASGFLQNALKFLLEHPYYFALLGVFIMLLLYAFYKINLFFKKAKKPNKA